VPVQGGAEDSERVFGQAPGAPEGQRGGQPATKARSPRGGPPLDPPTTVTGPWHDPGVAIADVSDLKLVELRRELLAAGYSRAKVDGCLGFVIGERTGEGRVTGSRQRAEYRRMLRTSTVRPEPGLWALWHDGDAA
jgi:hypothetical protein